MLKDKIKEFENLKSNILLKTKSFHQKFKNMKYNRVSFDICKIDIHRASYSRHLKIKKHLENISQNEVIIPRKNSIKQVVKEDIKVPDIDIQDKN